MADKVTWHGTWAPWYCPVLCLVTQSRPALFDPVDCSPPGSSVHGDSLARILEVGSHDLLHGPWYYSAVKKKKKEWNNIICSNLDGPRDYNTKWSKSERERQMPYDFTYIWNLKNKVEYRKRLYYKNTKKKKKTTKKPEKDSQIQRTNRWLPQGRRVEGQTKRMKGMKRYKLPDRKYISHWDIIFTERI